MNVWGETSNYVGMHTYKHMFVYLLYASGPCV